MQRTIEKLRKQLKSHTNITNDYRVKKQKALGAAGVQGQGSTTPTGQEHLPVPGAVVSQTGQTVIGQTTTPTGTNQIPNPGMQPTMTGQFQQGMVVNRMPGQQQTIPIQMQQQNQGVMLQQQPQQQQRMQIMPGQQPGMPQRMMISPQQQQLQMQIPPLQIPAHQLNQINQMPPQQRHNVLQKLQHDHQVRFQQQQQQQQQVMNPQQMQLMQQQRMRAQQMGQPINTGGIQPQQQPQPQQQMMLTRMQGNPGGPIQQLQQQVRMPITSQGHPGQIQAQMQTIQVQPGQIAVSSSAGMTIQRQQAPPMQMVQGQMMQQQRPLVQMQGTIGQIQGTVQNFPQQQGAQPIVQGQVTQASFSHGQQISLPQQQPQTSPHVSNPASLGGSPHSMNQPSPHSSQPSPQSFPAASPGPPGAVRPQGIPSPMNMPPSSPSMSSPGPNAPGSAQPGMSPMNVPSQSPQPSSMSPSPQFNQSLHGQMQSQSPHSMQQSSPRMPGQVSQLFVGTTNPRTVSVNKVLVILTKKYQFRTRIFS